MSTSTLAQATKVDTARLPLIDERTSTIAGGMDTLKTQGDGKMKLIHVHQDLLANAVSESATKTRNP